MWGFYTHKVGNALWPAVGRIVGSRDLKGIVVRVRKSRDDEAGAAAVEFGLILPLFALLLFGLIEFGFYFWTAETTSSASRETARRLIVGDCWANPNAFAASHGPRVTSTTVKNGADVTITSPAGMDVGDKIKVQVTADSGLINFIPGIPDTVTRQYEARLEVNNSSGTC